jgi:hypothetical protein
MSLNIFNPRQDGTLRHSVHSPGGGKACATAHTSLRVCVLTAHHTAQHKQEAEHSLLAPRLAGTCRLSARASILFLLNTKTTQGSSSLHTAQHSTAGHSTAQHTVRSGMESAWLAMVQATVWDGGRGLPSLRWAAQGCPPTRHHHHHNSRMAPHSPRTSSSTHPPFA